MPESALLILVPQAESLVSRWRREFDPSASVGVPAHVTLIYPFVPAEAIGASEIATLRMLFGAASSFAFELTSSARFPTMVYLRPVPDEPIRALTASLERAFPAYPPYGGAFDEVIPHLTVAEIGDEDVLTRIETELPSGIRIHVEVDEATLMTQRSDGFWRVAETFALGAR